jgi:hypothetical protein
VTVWESALMNFLIQKNSEKSEMKRRVDGESVSRGGKQISHPGFYFHASSEKVSQTFYLVNDGKMEKLLNKKQIFCKT